MKALQRVEREKKRIKMCGREGLVVGVLSNLYGPHVVIVIYDGAIGIYCLKPKNRKEEFFKISV